MRKVTVFLVTSLLLSLMVASIAGAQVVHLDKSNFDLGDMNQNESRDIQVIVTNNGGGLLVISEVKADCGCTIPVLKKTELTPGESTTIDINFNSKKFHGNVTKIVHVLSNDPGSPDTPIIILAHIFAPLLIDPENQQLNFPQTPLGTTATKKIIFTAVQAPTLEIKAKKTHKGLFQVSAINNYEGNPQVSALVVTVPENMPAGRQRDNVRVKTNIAGEEYVDISLSAWQTMSLLASPDKINFRYKKSFSKTLEIVPQVDDVEYKITKVECDLPEIKVVLEKNSGQNTKIIVTGSPISKDSPRAQKSKGKIKGTIIIHTTAKGLPLIEVPLSYMVRM